MALDLIKEFLVGIGFDVDAASLKNAEQSMDKAEQTVKKFNDNSNKGFSESSNSLKSLFTLLSTSGGSVGKLFPELQIPFKNLIKDINTVKGLYKELSTNSNNPEKPKEKPTPKGKNNIDTSKQEVTTEIKNMLPPIKKLETEGLGSIKIFSAEAVASFAAVATGIAAVVAVGTGLTSFLTSLAKQDIEYDKLARQLWTTKENAKEIDTALKTMGITMKDLWLSPELLQQFNQLRKDSAALKLPPEYQKNLQVVKSLVFEFQRLKQLGTLAFQWIGNYILKYAAGPLAQFQEALNKFNNWLVKNIPEAAKVIGSTLGVAFRLILVAIQAISMAIEPIIDFLNFIGEGFEKLPVPLQNIIKLFILLGAAMMMGPWGAIILILTALDDLFTALRGGHSVIGSFFNGLDEKAKNSAKNISKWFKDMKNDFHKDMASLKGDWDYYWNYYLNKAKQVLEKLLGMAKEKGEKIKEALKPYWADIKGFFTGGVKDTPEAKTAIKDFANSISSFKKNYQLPSYLIPSTSNTKNSTTNNSNATTNNFTIYSSDATSTANAVSSKINNGKNIRNLQGVTW